MTGRLPAVFDVENPSQADGYDGSVYTARAILARDNPELFDPNIDISADPSLWEGEDYSRVIYPKGKMPDWKDKLGASVSQLNTLINYNDKNNLEAARASKEELDVPDTVLVEMLPTEFQSLVLNEKYENGGVAAITLREQLLEDIANNTIMDNMEWYEQLGYSAASLAIDPTTYAAGGVGVKVGASASNVAAKGAKLLGKSMPANARVLTTYGTAGVIESAATNAPRLGGDHTYTVEDYQADLVVDALVGTGLVYGGSKLFNGFKSYKTQSEIRRRAAQENIDNMKRELETGSSRVIDFDPNSKLRPEGAPPVRPDATFKQNVQETLSYRARTNNLDMQWRVPEAPTTPADEVIETKLEDMLEYPVFKIDNDMAWLGTQLVDLTEQVKQLRKFRNKMDVETISNHPAFRNPTRENVADLTRQVEDKIGEAWRVTGNQAKVEKHSMQLGVPVGKEVSTDVMTPDVQQAWVELEGQGLAIKREIGVTPDGQPQYAYQIKTNDSSPRIDSEQPKPLAPEMAAVLRKIDSERAQAQITATRNANRQQNKVTINYGSIETPVQKSDYVIQTSELDKAIEVHNKQESIVQEQSPTMTKTVQNSDEVPTVHIVQEVDNLKQAQQQAKADSAQQPVPDKYAEMNWADIKKNGDKVQSPWIAPDGKVYSTEGDHVELAYDMDAESDMYSGGWDNGLIRMSAAVEGQADVPFISYHIGENQLLTQKQYDMAEEFLNENTGSRMLWQVGNTNDGAAEITLDELKKYVKQDVPKEIEQLDLTTGKLEAAEDAAVAVVQNNAVAKAVGDSLLKKSFDKLSTMITDYHGSGEHKVYKDLLTPANIKQWAAQAVSQWGGVTQDLATKFIKSDNPTLNWVGTHLTEMGRGYGGDVMRKHTAGVIKESEYLRSISQIMPSYDKAVKEYAASKGSKAVGQMMAAVSAGGRNKLQDEFARKFMLYMNDMRLGKELPDEPVIAKFAKDWDKYMSHNYATLVSNKIAGFTGNNKINNYVPQVWNVKHAQRLLREDEETVRQLLTKAIRTEDPEGAADALIRWMKEENADGYDGYLATNDARSIERINLDWNTEHNGTTILDLLETDTRKLSTNYSNRVAGWAGVSKASNGKVTSYTDLNSLQLAAYEANKNIDEAMVVRDVIDSLFGRPIQGGLQDWQRSLKTASVLTKLGGLGSAQLIETGTVATRAVMESAGDPKFMKKLIRGLSPEETAQDLVEIQKLTGNNWDYHLFNTEAEYYTEYDLANTNKVTNALDWAVDKMTGGGLKQVAGRAFGHVTGYNAVRKYQSAMLQRSFAMQVARYFKHGHTKMSVERMADYGLTDIAGNNNRLQRAIREHVEFDGDGYPSKYNFDKWDAQAKDDFMYAMQRAEAQELLRPLIGEMPEWFNKPWVQMLLQFRTMPLVAQNKALGRSLAFADKEAITQLMLNSMTAGLVRYGKFAGLAAVAAGTTGDWEAEYEKQLDRAGRDAILGGATDRYITQLGGVADVYSLTQIYGTANTPDEYARKVANQIPALSLLGDYAGAAYQASQDDGDRAMKHVQGLMFLGNTLAVDAAGSVIEETVKGD